MINVIFLVYNLILGLNMRLLLIHAKKFWWKIREPAKISFRDEVEVDEVEVKDVLVSFTCVEKSDEVNIEDSVSRAVEAIVEVASRIGVKKIVVYPYAHLSKNLSKPEIAVKVIHGIETKLKEVGFEVYRSPFGYYKEFILHCIGHPLAESLRLI